MPEYLENPRRVPRVEVRCDARVFLATGAVDTVTEDIGSRGCRVVLHAQAQRGDAVGLALSAPRYPLTLRVDGRVAWVSPHAPWRVGIAYAAQVLPEAARWFEGLRQSVPELFTLRRPLQRLPVDGMIFLGPVPRLPDFRDDEVVVLRTIGAGIRVGDLRTALSRTWPRMLRALFTLLAQGHVIVSRALATHPVKWKHVLGEPLRAGGEVAPAEEGADDLELVTGGPPPLGDPSTASSPPPSSRVTSKLPVASASQPVSRRIEEGIEPVENPRTAPSASPRPPPAPPSRTPAPTPPPLPRQEFVPPTGRPDAAAGRAQPAREAPPTPDFAGAGVGWRAPARLRSPEADDLLKLGLAELEAHRSHGALALLRRALSLAPGDVEIATAIGRAMRRDEPEKR